MRIWTLLLSVAVALTLGAAGSRGAEATSENVRAVLVDGTGTYSRPISTDSAEAQKFFDQGLRLTWGYYFPDAAASYLEALRHAPEHPMILWGLAFATGPNPNSRYMGAPDDPKGEGKRAITKARELSSSPGVTATERDFIETLCVRYDTERYPDRDARDRAYLEATRALHERHPDDPDATALYADAFMTASPWTYWERSGAPRKGTLEVARALERSMEAHPDHPGTNHLYIHLFEASSEPEKALAQADRLESLMPGAGHIVHMPTHIYVRVGDFPRAIAWNERSIAADQRFLEQWGELPFPPFTTYPLSARLHATHAHDFIRYAATIEGNYARALEAAREAESVVVSVAGLDNGRAQRTVAAVWLVHKIFGKWDAILEGEGPPKRGYPYLDGMWSYARGSAFAAMGRLAEARDELVKLEAQAQSPEAEGLVMVTKAKTVLCLAALGLSGEIAEAEGRPHDAVTAFEKAVTLEDGFGYMEPPDWPQPMRLSLGAALLASGSAERAESVYREDLAWNRDNGWALFGLWKSLEAQGREAEAREAQARFETAWRDADVTLSRSRF